jgi:histidine triad (HIT) family protein
METHDDFYCRQVLSGLLPVEKVRETANVLAFKHTKPSWPVHLVIIPKFHCESILEMWREHPQVLAEMMDVIVDVMTAVAADHLGCRLTTNIGRLQATKHLHWHVYVSGEMLA